MISKRWWGVRFEVWYLKTGNILRKFLDCTGIDSGRRWRYGERGARAYNGALGVEPPASPWSGGQGQSPSETESLFNFYSTSESGKFCIIRKRQLFVTHVTSFYASRDTATYQDNKLNTKNRCKPILEEMRGQTTLLDPDFQKWGGVSWSLDLVLQRSMATFTHLSIGLHVECGRQIEHWHCVSKVSRKESPCILHWVPP